MELKMKTKLGSMIATVLVLAAATVAYGTDYYVDANYGNDAWDGTTAVIPDAATIEAGEIGRASCRERV